MLIYTFIALSESNRGIQGSHRINISDIFTLHGADKEDLEKQIVTRQERTVKRILDGEWFDTMSDSNRLGWGVNVEQPPTLDEWEIGVDWDNAQPGAFIEFVHRAIPSKSDVNTLVGLDLEYYLEAFEGLVDASFISRVRSRFNNAQYDNMLVDQFTAALIEQLRKHNLLTKEQLADSQLLTDFL